MVGLVRICLAPTDHGYTSCFFVSVIKYLKEALRRRVYFRLGLVVVGSAVEQLRLLTSLPTAELFQLARQE